MPFWTLYAIGAASAALVALAVGLWTRKLFTGAL